MSDQLKYYVVGDKGLNYGNGTYVESMEKLKSALLKTKPKGAWTLVISMHGAEDLLATTGGFLRDRNGDGAYDAKKIKSIFGDNAFTAWKKKYGPTKVMMNSCQINQSFERVLFDSFLKDPSKQAATGLGKDCRPATSVLTLQYVSEGPRGVERVTVISNRRQWAKVPQASKKDLLANLAEINKKYGYFGVIKASSSNQLLHYYFDEEPFGGWPIVRLNVDRKTLDISYISRSSNPDFLTKHCPGHLGPLLRERKLLLPPAPTR